MRPNIVDVTLENLSSHPGVVCFINEKHPTHNIKINWLKKRFEEGLKVKLLYIEGQKSPAGFIEYVPGENAWRAINAKDYLFIHCIWTNPRKVRNQGLGKMLIDEVVKDAEKQKMLGVAVIVSEGSFMSKREIFVKNGFESVSVNSPYELLIKKLKEGPLPSFKDYESQLSKYKGFNILYTNQCPWISRFIIEVEPLIKEMRLDVNMKELKIAEEAQNAPSIYASFNLIYNGKLISDHYISMTRFKNILKKEIK